MRNGMFMGTYYLQLLNCPYLPLPQDWTIGDTRYGMFVGRSGSCCSACSLRIAWREWSLVSPTWRALAFGGGGVYRVLGSRRSCQGGATAASMLRPIDRPAARTSTTSRSVSTAPETHDLY